MLNQNFHEKVVLKSSQLTPVSSPCDGVERTLLERNENSEYAISTTIVEFKPNSFFDEHVHDSGEELLVLEGTFSDEFGDYPAGTYLRNPDNTSHIPFSKDGCLIFVKLIIESCLTEPPSEISCFRDMTLYAKSWTMIGAQKS